MRTIAIAMFSGLVLFFIQGCKDTKMVFDKSRPEVPFLFIYRTSGYPALNQKPPCGLVIAIWQDGKIVRAKSAAKVGRPHLEGKLTTEQLRRLLVIIEQSGALSCRAKQYVIIDGSNEELTLRLSNGLVTWAASPDLASCNQQGIKDLREYLLKLKAAHEIATEWPKEYPTEWSR